MIYFAYSTNTETLLALRRKYGKLIKMGGYLNLPKVTYFLTLMMPCLNAAMMRER